jgi:hypothetical protein
VVDDSDWTRKVREKAGDTTMKTGESRWKTGENCKEIGKSTEREREKERERDWRILGGNWRNH